MKFLKTAYDVVTDTVAEHSVSAIVWTIFSVSVWLLFSAIYYYYSLVF